MPHDLAEQNGRIAMMYVGNPPWHGLGQQLNRPATSREAIEAALLNWEVIKVPLFLKGRGRYGRVENKFAVVRADWTPRADARALGVVGKQYEPLQNRDAFAWFDGIVGQGAAIYHTAGALGDGERVWILAKLPGEIRIVGDDVADKFLLLSNSHDGRSGVQVKFTPIRVVCQNTLTMALGMGKTLVVKHTRSLHDQLELAKENLGIIGERYSRISETFREMSAVAMTPDRLRIYHELVFPEPENKKDERALSRIIEARTAATALFESGKGNNAPRVKGTLWAAYNGVTQYVDYKPNRNGPEHRLESAWFGTGYLTKVRAYRTALDQMASWRN